MRKEIEHGELKAVPLQDDPFPLSQTYLMYPEDLLSSLDQLLLRHVEERYKLRYRRQILPGFFAFNALYGKISP